MPRWIQIIRSSHGSCLHIARETEIHFQILVQSLLSLEKGKGKGIFLAFKETQKETWKYTAEHKVPRVSSSKTAESRLWGCTLWKGQKEALGCRGLVWEGRWKTLPNSVRKTKCYSSTLCWLLSFVQCSSPEHSHTTLALQLVSQSNTQHLWARQQQSR